MLPSAAAVFQVIVLSTSPNILIVNVFCFSAIKDALLILVYLLADTVNLYSLVTAGI